jgi:tRNA threonylcarbamoyladenosine biosynthesis protein TsaB
MALILSLETSGTACAVALHAGGTLVKSLEVNEPQAHAAKLAVLVKEVLQQAGFAVHQLQAVAVSAGPGSYTGLRIGTSTAKGICYALNIPLIAIDTLEVLAFAFRRQSGAEKGLLCPMIDARRMEVYCQVMDTTLAVVQPVEAKIIDNTSFAELLKQQQMFFFGDGAGKCRGVISHENAVFADNIGPEAPALGEMAFAKFVKKEFEDLETFTPFYLKDFIAKKAQSVF